MKQTFPYSINPESYATSGQEFWKDWNIDVRFANYHPF